MPWRSRLWAIGLCLLLTAPDARCQDAAIGEPAASGSSSAGVSPGAPAVSYAIKLTRPLAPHDRFFMHVTGSSDTVQTRLSEGDNKVHTGFAVEARGLVAVLSVNAFGQPTAYDFVVTSFTRDGKSLLPEGTRITASSAGGRSTYTLGGKAAAADITAALMLALPTRDPADAQSEEVIFGTPQPQRVGGTWNIDAAGAARQLAASGLAIPPDKVQGGGTLAAIETVAGRDLARVEIHVNADRVYPNPARTPGAGEHFSVHVSLTKLLPIDPTALVASASERFYFASDDDANVIIPEYHGGPMLAVEVIRRTEFGPRLPGIATARP